MPRDYLVEKKVSSDLTFAKGILLLDQCENTLPWSIDGTGVDYDIAIKREAAFFGKAGIRLRTKETAPALNDIVTATRLIPFPETNLLVYRLMICVWDLTKTSAIFIRADFNDGSNAYSAALKWLPDDKELRYLDKIGRYIVIQGYGQEGSDEGWISIEMVVQLTNHKYISCTFNGIKTALNTKYIQHEAVVSDIYHTFAIGQVAGTANRSVIYFDSVYIGEYLNI